MHEVSCTRCGNTAEGLENAPLPGEIGGRVQASACRACWSEWLGAQVILINERSLSPAKPADYEALLQEMTAFLKLADR
jgi:Fe-S cluster biosynthesis and repair protein YggX